MKQPTAEDVMAAVEILRLDREVCSEQGENVLPELLEQTLRAGRVIAMWLDQFDEAEEEEGSYFSLAEAEAILVRRGRLVPSATEG